MRALGLGVAVCLSLTAFACGPRETSAPGPSGHAPLAGAPPARNGAAKAGALDPCAGMFHALCNDRDLAAMGAKMESALSKAAAAVSPQGIKVLAANEQQWLESQRVACAIPKGATDLSERQATCLKAAFAARVQDVMTAIEKRGPFIFQRVEINRTDKVKPSNATRLMGAAAPTSLSHSISYPRIDGDGPTIEKFNEAVRQAPRFIPSDQTEESTTYEIGYVGPDLISVRFDFHDLTVGAAHPNVSMRAFSFDVRSGAQLTAADIFKPGADWQNFLARRAARELTKQLRAQDETARPVDPAEIRGAVAQPDSWFITDRALILVFPIGALAPASMEATQVSIPWRDLKPYLNPQGPGPIKSA